MTRIRRSNYSQRPVGRSRDAQGRLVKDGQPLQIEMMYTAKSLEPYLTVYQDDLRKVGINLNLRFVTPETQFQLISDRRFPT